MEDSNVKTGLLEAETKLLMGQLSVDQPQLEEFVMDSEEEENERHI